MTGDEFSREAGGRAPRHMSSLAVWSFVLGLLFFIPFVGPVAILCGMLALGGIGNSDGTLRGRGLAIAGMILGAFSIVFMCIWVTVLFLLLVLAGNKQQAQAADCRSNLKHIGVAIEMYKANLGELPPDLQAVVDKGYIGAGMLRCPAHGRDDAASSRDVDAKSDYYYALVKSTSGAPQPIPVAWDKAHFHGRKGVNVLFANGSQRLIKTEELDRLVKENAFRYERPPKLPDEGEAPAPEVSSQAATPEAGRLVRTESSAAAGAVESTSAALSERAGKLLTAKTAKVNAQLKRAIFTFQCKSTSRTFHVAEEELADADVYRTYMVDYGAEVACRICGYKDALQVYYCSQCKRYYAYEPRHESALAITCPKGHKVPQEDH